MSQEIWQQLETRFGSRATQDPFELAFYERDLAPVPDFLVKLVAQTRPDMVLRPQTTEEVSALTTLASRAKIPITARAGGSTVFFNTVCMSHGIVVDMSGLNQLLEVDEGRKTVRVGAGMTWLDLERALGRVGLAVCSYPSSAPSATIGGRLAMVGYGLGSIRYGPVLEQVLSARTVMADGSVQDLTQASDPPVSWLAGSEGTLGLVTEVELSVRTRPAKEYHSLTAYRNAAAMQQGIEAALRLTEKPFNLHFSDPGCNALRHRLGMAGAEAAEAYTLAFDADGSEAGTEAARQEWTACVCATQGQDLGCEAEEEWRHRFFSFILKREAPTLLGAEIWLPVKQIAAYLQDIDDFGRKKSMDFKSYGHVVTAEHALVMTMFNADERDQLGFLQGLGLVKKIHDVSAARGACPYGVGLWNTPYLSRCFSPEKLAELKARKRRLDPDNILNPGKLYQAPLLLHPLLFGFGMDVLAATTAIYRGKLGGAPS